MKKTIKKSYLFIVMLTFMIVLFSSLIASIFIFPKQALALSNPSSAIQVANGAELYDYKTKSFNSFAIADLNKKLFDEKDPINYIKSSLDSHTNSYVVPASKINAGVGNVNDGLVLTLGGYEWIVTSLTLTDSSVSSKEDIVMTLYLSDASSINTEFNNASGTTKGDNAYSSSILRNKLLTKSNFTQFASGQFAGKYLVQPKNIRYQQIQSFKRFSSGYNNLPNEALYDLTTGWNPNVTYKPADTFLDPNGEIVRYDSWGEDYIWIPSTSETICMYGGVQISNTSIWQLSPNQQKASRNAWSRSGCFVYSSIMTFNTSDKTEIIHAPINENYYIRPAIHLNLSEVIASLINEIDNPQDLSSTYNTNAQSISDIVKVNSNTSWYNKNLYETDNEYIKITYPNNTTTFTNAGEYWIKVEIKESWTNKIIALVEQDAAIYNWTEAEKQQVIDFRKPKFLGTANTSDTEHPETDTVRWIKITINKAEIDFSKVTWSQNEFEYNGQIQSVKITSGLPSFLTAEYDHNAKSAVGEYTASVIKFTGSDPNYKTYTSAELANIPQLKHNWKITKKKVAVSWTKKNVTIGDITLPIPRLQVAENLANAIEYKYFRKSDLTDEVTLEQIFAENDISEVKSYYVQAIFTTDPIDFNNTNCIFVVDGNEENSVSEVFQTGSVINKVQVSLKNNRFTYNGVAQQAEFNVVGGGLTASNLVISYTTADGTPLSGAPTNVGRYKVLVGLQSGLDDFMIVGEDTFDYEIESLKIRKPKADQVNIFDAEGFGLSAVANMPTNWKSYFEITVDGNVVDESYKFTKAGKYSIQIAFKNGVNTANGGDVDNVVWEDRDNTTYTITLDIQTLEFEISGWQNGTGNKRPTILSDEKSEIEKYFDYEIYQVKDGQIIGNVILPNATLKYDTDYQISLKVKNEYKGSVFVKYNGELVDETETYSFKTEVNPNPSGGDGEDDNNGTDGKPNGGNNGGMDSFVEDIKNMPSYLKWIFIGIIVLLILLIILIIILLIVKSSKNKNTPQQAIPYAQYAANNGQQAVNENNGATNTNTEDIKPKEVVNVRGTIVNNYKVGYKDWTFVIKENDVLNLNVLEAPQERILFYALKESEAKKVKKLQNQITPADGVDTDKIDEDSKPNSKLNKKKRRK